MLEGMRRKQVIVTIIRLEFEVAELLEPEMKMRILMMEATK